MDTISNNSKNQSDWYFLLNAAINATIKRSRFYPLPRDLCFPEEKALFKKWSQDKKVLVEIGVFEGASAAVFRKMMSPEAVLHLIDPFIPDSMNPILCGRKWMAKLNVKRIANGRVAWYEDFSFNVVRGWNKEIDFLFIDGDHSEKACYQDWLDWSKFVRQDGIVIFHDARFGVTNGKRWDGWEGPTNVVNQLFRGENKLPNWRIVDEAGTAVVVKRVD